jgi:hypothetical protein
MNILVEDYSKPYRDEVVRYLDLIPTTDVGLNLYKFMPKIVRDIGWKAQIRLCARYRRLSVCGKTANVVNVAIARDMVGFIWSIGTRSNPRQRRRDHSLTSASRGGRK